MTKTKSQSEFLIKLNGECWHKSSGMTWICGNCKTDVGWDNSGKGNHVTVESLNPDLSEWGNIPKLRKIARDNHIFIQISDAWENVDIVTPMGITLNSKKYKYFKEVPSILLDMVARALGWKEEK